jgi:adenine-specific DNA-methyltransferase
LTYLDRNSVARGKAFGAIAPILWLRYGSTGPCITKVTRSFAAPAGASYAILFDINQWPAFANEVREREDLTSVCIVTDSIAQFQQVVAELPPQIKASMLYEDYIRNFEINTGVDQ